MVRRVVALMSALVLATAPMALMAQEVGITRSSSAELPFTLIYPQPLVATPNGDASVTVNNPNALLQCEASAVPVDDTAWTPDSALASFDESQVATAWESTLPGFAVTGKGTVAYQDGTALTYEGDSIGSDLGVPVTLVHLETVQGKGGYVVDCYYATSEAAVARPVVDFIIGNFSTRADAECCKVQLPAATEAVAPAQ